MAGKAQEPKQPRDYAEPQPYYHEESDHDDTSLYFIAWIMGGVMGFVAGFCTALLVLT